jgi:TatD DNase family protein
MTWFDTHCHLNHPDFDHDWGEVFHRALGQGVRRLLVVGYDRSSSERALALADGVSIWAAIGFHPSEAGKVTPEDLAWLAQQLDHPFVAAVGEVGVDLHWRQDDLDAQLTLFEVQLALAAARDRPVVIHQRDAAQEVHRVLRRHAVRGILHCFTGDVQELSSALDLPFVFALGGAVTFRRNEALREAARSIPAGRLVLETDAPYMAPQPFRGQRNEPAHIVAVGEVVAAVRGMTVQELAEETWQTACTSLGLPSGP